MIITRGVIADHERTLEEIVRATRLPVSIIFVGVGKDRGSKFKKLEFLDGEENEDGTIELRDRNGNMAERDIVQFVSFRQYRHDYE